MKLKKFISLTLATLMILSSQVVFADDTGISDGTQNEPVEIEVGMDKEHPIEINSALGLFEIRYEKDWNKKYYKLTSDIDLGDIKKNLEDLSADNDADKNAKEDLSALTESETWISPKEDFFGDFNGNGCTIKNLVQKHFPEGSSKGIGYGGLFATVGDAASIYDLNIENSSIVYDTDIESLSNYNTAGAICGRVNGNVNIKNCKVNNICVEAAKAGGLVGSIEAKKTSSVIIENNSVYNSDIRAVSVGNSAQKAAGGLVGRTMWMNASTSSICRNEIFSTKISFGKFGNGGNELCIGGCIGMAAQDCEYTIKDIYIENIEVSGDTSDLSNSRISCVYAGGVIGESYYNNIENAYVKNLKTTIKQQNETIKVGIGGIVGGVTVEPDDSYTIAKFNGKIKDSYTSFDDNTNLIKVIVGMNPKDSATLGYLDDYDKDSYNGIATDCYYDVEQYTGDITDQPTGISPVAYAIAPKTASSDKVEDASAKDEVLNTKTSAEFVVKAYAVEKNEDGSVKYDETTGEPVVGDEIEGFMDKFGSAVSVTDWKVAVGESIGEGDDAVKCDDAVTADNTTVKADADGMSAVLTSNANAGTKEAPATIIISAKVNGAEKKLAVPYYYVRSSSGGGGGSSSSTPATETTTKTNADGSTTVTVKNNTTGTVTETTTAKDGTKTVVETKKDGTVTTTVTKADGTSLKTVKTADGSTTVNTGSKSPVKVTLPAAGAGTVVVRVKADGSEEIIKDSVVTGSGITFMANDGDVVKIRDSGVSFKDVAAGSWMADAVAYVTGRELFKGVSSDEFGPSGSMTRGMLAAVLYRYAGEPDAATANSFSDVKAGAYYENAVKWAAANGIVTGYADGTFGPDKSVTREQLAAILYRYAGSPQETGTLGGFNDAGSVSDYAANAVSWAVKAGIIAGNGDSSTLDPQGSATRAQVATMIKRFAEYRMA